MHRASTFFALVVVTMLLGTLIAVRSLEAQELLTVGIEMEQEAWNRYRFVADTNRAQGVSVEWSFGDGIQVRGTSATHTYRFAGDYVVSAVATDATGAHAQVKTAVAISFWHLGNWQLWSMIALLFAVTIALLWATREQRQEHVFSFDDGDVMGEDDTALPPVLRERMEPREGASVKRTKSRAKPRARKRTAKKLSSRARTTRRTVKQEATPAASETIVALESSESES